MDLFELLVVLFLAVVAWFHFLRSDSGKRPPGPYPFPIVGNIFQLGRNPHHSLAKLSKTFGPLMSLKLGSTYAIVVSSSEIAKEILQKNDSVFSGRFNPVAVHAHDHHKTSVTCLPPGNQWKKLRKICKEQLFSTHRLDASQGLREANLQKLSEYVQKCCDSGREVNIGEAAFITMLNLMSATLFSSEFTNFDSDTNQEIKETFHGVMKYVGVPNISDFIPIFKLIDPQGIERKAEFYLGKLLSIIEDIINQRLKSRGASLDYQKKNDLLETLLDLSEGSEYDLSTNEIQHLLLDLMIAGSDTTASATEWTMTELLLNPEKLSKAKHELRTVIGQNKQIQESDISKLPYLEATIKEVIRLHPPAPLLAPHKSEGQAQVSGYIIPKDTRVLINAWAIHREPSLWPNPNSFEPERFLDKNISFRGQDFELIPFGSGRRICPGLPLANRMLHALVVTLIQNFDWKFEVGAEGEDAHREEEFGLSVQKAIPLKATPIKL
uniref:Miltiradiene/abietatriene hydroxylase n=1 Tax=Callicarpa americana TaxID=204211 RepID=A0A977LLQ3_CALAM|nr:putative miltiradiene/abietatriene hydroxylase [Callicarpa americana]